MHSIRRSLLALGLVLPLALPIAAQAAPERDAATDAEAQAKQELADLQKAYSAARNEYYAKRREIAKQRKENPGAAVEMPTSPDAEYIAKFKQRAEHYAGSELAAPFLVKVVSMASRTDAPTAKSALSTLLSKHMDSAQLDQLTFTLIYGAHSMGRDTVEQAMTTIVDGSPHDSVKAAFLYGLGSLVNRSRDATSEQRAAAVVNLRRSEALASESRYGKMATSTIFELERLQIGMTAPDIDGKDLDGVAFKLSDYRGKVVVLDFWGDW